MNATYVTNHFHLVGHSLGAQIAGSAGRNYRQMSGGLILKRITGLDPANPCFYDGNDLEGLRSGDARFVDIIHSNPGMLGSPKRSGDADFFVQGRVPFKEGCEGLSTISCSHQRAVDYWTETVYPSNANEITSQNVDTINPEEMISDFVNTFGNESLIYLRNKSFNKTSTEKEIILDFLRDDNTNYCKNGFYNDWKRTGLEASDRLNLRQLPTSFQELLLDRLQDQLRQLFVGLPLDIAFSTLNYICSTIVDLGVVRSKIVPDVSRMSFLLRTEQECQNTSIPLTQAEELWNTPGFYQDRPTVLFITGWTTSINNSNSGPVAKAYACRNDTNILVSREILVKN